MMILNSNDQFENPTMPDWLFHSLLIGFQNKDKDLIKGYNSIWEGIRNRGEKI